MADNTTLPAGAGGDTIRTEDVGGGVKIQVIKIHTGATDGVDSGPVSLTNGFPVAMSDGTNQIGTSSHPVRTDPTGTTTQPVSFSGALPAGTNAIGTVSIVSGGNTMPTMDAAARRAFVTVTDGTNTLPTGDAPARALQVTPGDGTHVATFKAASTASVTGDTSEVVQLHPSGLGGTAALPLFSSVVDNASHVQPAGDVATRAIYEQLTDGTNLIGVPAHPLAANLWLPETTLHSVKGIYYVANTAIGTPVSTGAPPTSFSATTGILAITNQNASGDLLVLDYIRIIITTPSSSSTNWQFALKTDNSTSARASAGTSLTGQNTRQDQSNDSGVLIIVNPTLAAENAARPIAQGFGWTVIPTAGTEIVFVFGGKERAVTNTVSAGAQTACKCVPPVVLAGGTNTNNCLILHNWAAAASGAQSISVEVGYWHASTFGSN